MMGNFLKAIFKPLFEGFSLWRRLKDHSAVLEALRLRIVFTTVFGTVVFGGVAYRLCDIMLLQKGLQQQLAQKPARSGEECALKADITDRNGVILATCIKTASCYADPSVVIDIEASAQKLSKIPGMPNVEKIKQKLSDKNKHFVWLTRHVPPKIQQQIMDLGIPGIFLKKDYKRVYPYGHLFAHVTGRTDPDGVGTFGIEKSFHEELIVDEVSSRKLRLTVDLRIQSIVHDELKAAIDKFHAIGGNAMVINMKGEILAMVSLPDFDPNNVRQEDVDAMFNRNTLGTYEPGSTFKILNTTIALESGSATLESKFDASAPVRIGRFSITDFRGKTESYPWPKPSPFHPT